ncbi:MAG: tetratricopeptide repeat protein [Spirochaetales bacterium]|nr:tetratricopeptide repeat protein [Spirochaetales bacterium]
MRLKSWLSLEKSPASVHGILLFIGFVFTFYVMFLCGCETVVTGKELAQEYYNLGNAYYDIEKYEDAVFFYNKAIELDNTLFSAQFNLAFSYVKLGDSEKAITILNVILEKDPHNVDTLKLLGYACHMLGDEEQALVAYDNILAIAPEHKDALNNKAVIYWKLKKYEEAEAAFRMLLKTNPADFEALYNLGDLLFEMKKYEDAAFFIEQCIEAKPEDTKAYLKLASVYMALEKYYKVLDAYEGALAVDKKLKEAWFFKAALLLTKVQDPDKGLTYLAQALELGYNDKNEIRKLLSDPALLEKDDVYKLFREKGFEPTQLSSPAATEDTTTKTNNDAEQKDK